MGSGVDQGFPVFDVTHARLALCCVARGASGLAGLAPGELASPVQPEGVVHASFLRANTRLLPWEEEGPPKEDTGPCRRR